MTKWMMQLLVSGLLLTFSNAQAHEGHDHGAASFQPPKGGVLQTSFENHFELVKKGQVLFIYVYDQKGKTVETKGFKVSAELELPRKKKMPATLNDLGTHWESKIDMQGAHRMTFKLNVDNGKEKDYVQFTIENK